MQQQRNRDPASCPRDHALAGDGSSRFLDLCSPRADRGVGVRRVRTLALGLLKLGWTQYSNGFRSALDDRSARRSPALQHLLNEVDARLELFIRPVLQRI